MEQVNRLVLRGAVVVVAVPIVVLVLLSVIVGGTMVVNNLRLSEWKDDLYNLAPPPDARVVAKGTDFGLLGGNGNHCDRRAWVLLSTAANADEVERHYTGRLETESVWISVTTVERSEVRVEMFEPGDSAGWDPRCH